MVQEPLDLFVKQTVRPAFPDPLFVVKKVVPHHDLTGIVVGVTVFETCVYCGVRIRD